jgi:hypothetical protein
VFDALAAKENTSSKNVANGYAGLGSDGKLFSTQLPSITITDTFVVGSQAAMLALTAETGDVAVRTDVNKSFILKGSDPAVLANWQELLTPTSAVTSVFGRNGAVTAQNGDYTTALVTETTNKRYQTDNQQTYNDATSSIQTQLNAKENLSNKSTITTLGTSDTLYPTQNAVKTYVDTKVGGGVGSLEFNSTDLTVWNNGKSNVDTNTSFGEGALRSNTTGGWNTAYGQSTLYNNTTGNFNTAVGLASLPANQTGQLNTALGYGSLNTSLGNQNTGLGAASLGNTSSGSNNLASGYNSLGFNTTGSNNVALGTSAGSYISPSGNNVITNQSVYLGAETRTFANNQTNEIVVGYGAIGNGSNSVTLGNSSITKTVLKGNVGIGNTGPLTSLEVASNSSSWISGTFSGTGNTDKVVIGNLATPAIGGHNSALTAWSDFTIAGANILFSPYGSEKARITSLGLQTVGGQDGGIRVQTNGAAINLPTTGLSFSTGFSVGYIRNANSSGSVADLYIEALKVNFQNLGTGLVYSNGGFLTSTNPSDRRLKDNILNLQYGLNEILKLRPVSYNWKDDKINQGKQFGFIAQEVQEVMPELVKEFETKEGERLGLDKDGIYAALVKAIQEQQTQIKELRKEIEILKNK